MTLKSSQKSLIKQRRLWQVFGVALFTLLVGLAALPAPTEPLVPSGSISPAVWDPTDNKWETGNPDGYSEGETAAISVRLTADLAGTYQMYVCLEVEKNGPKYAFNDFGAWDDTVLPGSLPAANQAAEIAPVPAYPTNWDLDDPNVWGYGLTLTSIDVVGPEQGTGAPDCDPEYYGVLVTFSKTAGSPAWIVYGGRLAQALDPLPAGFTDTVVPIGAGASSINGTFQTRIGGAGDKTINFSGANTVDPIADLSIAKACADWSSTTYSEYTITVTNNGPSTANLLVMNDDLPVELTYTGQWTSKVGGIDAGSCSATDPVTCNLATLADGESWVITLGTTVNANVTPNSSISNTASVSQTPAIDPVPDTTNPNSDTESCTTPVTLSYFATEAGSDGVVTFEWTTSTETGNLGFNIYARTDEGLVKINDTLIPSETVSSAEPQDYRFEVAGVSASDYYIESVDVRGMVERRGPFAVNETFGERQAIELIDWEAVRAEHIQKANEQSASELRMRSMPRRGSLPRDLSIASASTAAVNVGVQADGIYRITYDQLQAAGMDLKGTPVGSIAVTNRGVPVPVYVQGNGIFKSGDYLEFYGREIDSLHTADNIYVIQVDESLVASIALDNSVPDRKSVAPEFYMETLTVDDNWYYARISPTGDPWIRDYVFSRSENYVKNYTINGVDNLVAGAAPVSAEVDVWGAYDATHRLGVQLNGVTLANGSFEGISVYPVSTTLPEGTLLNGSNTLSLIVGEKEDLIAYDRISLTYPRAYVARSGSLTFTAAGPVFEVSNLPSSDIVVYRMAGSSVERLTKVKTRLVDGTYTALFGGSEAAATYVVVSGESLATPSMLQAAQPYSDITSGTANTLIISHPDFIDELGPLAATRQAQGYAVKTIDVFDIYAQYSGGIVDPDAIREYLSHAIQNMGVEMVLLVGGDTLDPLNYLGYGAISFIPSLYATTGDLIQFAPVDPLYMDVNFDNVPDGIIARVPVRTSAELSNLIAKANAYVGKSYDSTAVFAADKAFTGDSENMQSLLPESWTVTDAYVGEIGAAAANAQLISKMNEGVALTSYFGHSSALQWTWDGLFSANDAASLTNYGKPTVVTQWGCWNTYYTQEKANSLAHKLLLSGTQGAVAVTGATTLTDAKSEALLGNLMMPLLVDGTSTIGEAMYQAKVQLAQSDPDRVDVLLGWTVLGVPWLQVR